jgi:sporulation protein YabP
MSESFEKKNHTLTLQNREVLELSGISDVTAFNEEEIVATCDWGDIMIKGSSLHVEILDLETGELKIVGKVAALVYNDRIQPKGFFKRVFS